MGDNHISPYLCNEELYIIVTENVCCFMVYICEYCIYRHGCRRLPLWVRKVVVSSVDSSLL